MKPLRAALALTFLLAACACAGEGDRGEVVLTFPGSALGAEGEVLAGQIGRYEAANPGVRVELQATPDAADQRHQLYVQWLAARADDPDVLQLDVVWTAELAAAGWILPLDRFGPDRDAFFPATVEAASWRGELYALPWFVDVGMLYWRTDLFDAPPADFATLAAAARSAMAGSAGGPASQGGQGGQRGLPYGYAWQGARYEGLVTVFLEHLAGFGGTILDADGRVTVDSPAGVAALTFLCDALTSGLTPRAALTWQEEQTRFAFQNGRAAFLRNWPYAYPLMNDPARSAVAGRFAVAVMPAAPGGRHAAALGGAQLAVNARSEHPQAAWRLIDFLTRPEQMLERARATGQFPARAALYDDPRLAGTLAVPPSEARRLLEAAVPRPVTPVYTELSQILQVHLHRALSGQQEPREALARAAAEMRTLLERAELAPPPAEGPEEGGPEERGPVSLGAATERPDPGLAGTRRLGSEEAGDA